jgi:hypothetical protein
LAKHLQLDGKQREALAQIIMQIAGQSHPFGLLRMY